MQDFFDVPTAGECHVWWAPVVSVGSLADGGAPPTEGSLLSTRTAVAALTAAERARAHALKVERVRSIFVASRALQRLVCAAYLGVDPAAVDISRRCPLCGDSDHGRPFAVDAGFDYSVARTDQWVVLAAVAADGASVGIPPGEVGVDVEAMPSLAQVDDLAVAALSAAEMRSLSDLPRVRWPMSFVRTWARKEAATKLTGYGLSVSFGDLDVDDGRLKVDRVPDGWPRIDINLYDIDAPTAHVAAVASTTEISRLSIRRA